MHNRSDHLLRFFMSVQSMCVCVISWKCYLCLVLETQTAISVVFQLDWLSMVFWLCILLFLVVLSFTIINLRS